jgi:integral membrane protein (TIGR01906 family)
MAMNRKQIVVAAIAALLPLVLLGNGVHVLANDWFVRFEYGRLAPEPYGLSTAQRTALAETALDSIVPFGGGDRVLAEARLPSGRAAFDDEERRHLTDVRRYVLGLYVLHAVGLAALVLLAVWRRARPVLRAGLLAGSALTLGLAAFVGLYVAISPVGFLGGFHRVFFSGDSWRFEETDTLRRLFPDRFWSDTAIALGLLVAVQAAALFAGALVWRRQAIKTRPRTAAHAR